MAAWNRDDDHMAPEKLRRPNSHPYPPHPGKSQNLIAPNSDNRRASDSQYGDVICGDLKRKRDRKSDVLSDGLNQPDNLCYGYESYLAYDTTSSGLRSVKEGDSFPSGQFGDFFNLSANSQIDSIWESDKKYDNLFSSQNQTGFCDNAGIRPSTQAQFGWSNNKKFSQVPLHPSVDLNTGTTTLPFQFNKWDSQDPGQENGANFEFNEKEMIEEIEYMFAQNEWDLPNIGPTSPETSNVDMSTDDKDQKSRCDEFKEGSFFSDLWSKMGGQERTKRPDDQPSDLTVENESSSGKTGSQQPKALSVEDLGDCSSLSKDEKVLLESILSKLNAKKHGNRLRGKGKQSEKMPGVTETLVKETDKSAIHKKSSITDRQSTDKCDVCKLGQSRLQENDTVIGSSGKVWNQGVQKAKSSSLSEQDSPMFGDDSAGSVRKRSKEEERDGNFQPESLSKRDHSGKNKEDIVFSPTPSKNAKMPTEKTLKKQKVLQSETEVPNLIQKENCQGSDVEMDNLEEEESKGRKSISGSNETKIFGSSAKRQLNDTGKHEETVEQPNHQGISPPQVKKKKKRKKKQGQSSKKNGKEEENSNTAPIPESYGVSEPVTLPDKQKEATSGIMRHDRKEEGCTVGDQGREQRVDSKVSSENKSQKPQKVISHQAEQKKSASEWTQVSGRKGGTSLPSKVKLVGKDWTNVTKDVSGKSHTGASEQSKPQGNVSGDAKVGSEKREKGRKNGAGSFEQQQRPKNFQEGQSDSDSISLKKRERESESHMTLKNLKEDKTTVPQPQPFPSKSKEHPSLVPSDRSQKIASSNSVPTTKAQGTQAVGKMETKANIVPNEAGHVLKDDIVKSNREASDSLPHASASSVSAASSPSSSTSTPLSSAYSSAGNEKCQKESKPKTLGSNVKKGSCDEGVTGNDEKGKQEKENDGKHEKRAESGGHHSESSHSQQYPDGGLYKPSHQAKRDPERKGESIKGKTFDELRGKRQDKHENERHQRERSGSGREKKPGRDSTAKSKQSGSSRSSQIFVNKDQNSAMRKKQITFDNLTAVIFAIITYLNSLAGEIWSELPQFGAVLLLCLLAQGLSVFHFYKNLTIIAVVDIFNFGTAILPGVLYKLSYIKYLWTYFLKPILIIALCLLCLACMFLFKLIQITFRLLRGVYRLIFPPKKDTFTHGEADPNTNETSRDGAGFHGDSFSQNEESQGQSHTSNGSSANNSGNSANFSGTGRESEGASFDNFNSYRRQEGMNGTFSGSPFGGSPFGGSSFSSQSSTTSSKSQSSQSSSDSRPDNKGAVNAIQRILQADEDDPYDVLGLNGDCLQEDIKKSYRRLAVLVHPDKCDHPHAQRAFQKLQVAHDKVGSEEKRAEFDLERRRFELGRAFMNECQKQYDLVKNSLSCQCGSLHPKTETDRNPWAARYCWQHGTFHPAQQNDIWAETSCMGLKIHCFFRDGDIVYDITHWAECQKILGRMEKNGCKVTVRMQGNPEPQKPPPNFEDFFWHYRSHAGSGTDRSRQRDKSNREKNNKKKKKNGRR